MKGRFNLIKISTMILIVTGILLAVVDDCGSSSVASHSNDGETNRGLKVPKKLASGFSKVKEGAGDLIDKVKDTAEDFYEKVKESARDFIDKAKDTDTAGSSIDTVSDTDTSGSFIDTAKDAAKYTAAWILLNVGLPTALGLLAVVVVICWFCKCVCCCC